MISSEDYVLHLKDGNKIKLPLFTYDNIDDIFDNPTEVYYKGELYTADTQGVINLLNTNAKLSIDTYQGYTHGKEALQKKLISLLDSNNSYCNNGKLFRFF